MLWIAVAALAACGRDCAPGAPAGCTCVARRHHPAGWQVHETANFQVWSRPSTVDGRGLAKNCEAWRAALQTNWFGEASAGSWEPKCQIVIHPTVAEYNQALGCVNDRSVGCTTLKIDEGRVVCRRIDLRADASEWMFSALPHELTHVVVADRLDRRSLPPWADEGMAALAEPDETRARRFNALQQARDSGHLYRVRDLLRLRQPPRPEYRHAFYGQSVSLVRFLVQRDTPRRFVEFVQITADRGDDAALKEVYGIRDADHLEQIWRSWTPMPAATMRSRPGVLLDTISLGQASGAGRRAIPTQQ